MATRKKKEDRRQVTALLPGVWLSDSDFSYVTVDDAIKSLERIRDEHPGKTLELRYESEPYSDDKSFSVYERRPETDEEMATRQAREDRQKKDMEARERAELERLQKKFGPR